MARDYLSQVFTSRGSKIQEVLRARRYHRMYRDVEVANKFVEIFLVHSWAEHLRQHERQTKADRELEERVYSYVSGEPKVRHLLNADWTKP